MVNIKLGKDRYLRDETNAWVVGHEQTGTMVNIKLGKDRYLRGETNAWVVGHEQTDTGGRTTFTADKYFMSLSALGNYLLADRLRKSDAASMTDLVAEHKGDCLD